MFFSAVLFTKRGNLAKVWLAAHHQDKRLTKAIVVSTNIEECSHELSEPAVPLSLRISGQLLLGVVRIYQRKVRYLQEDTQDALAKVRMSSRPGSGALELHPAHAMASSSHITFTDPTEADFLDFAIPDIPLGRLEAFGDDDGFSQQEMGRAHDPTLDQDDDRFSYNLSVNQGAKQFEDAHDVLMAGEEEDIIQIEPLNDRLDQSIEMGRDAPDFDVDYSLPPIDIEYDESVKHDDNTVVAAAEHVDMVGDPIPFIDSVQDNASHNDQQSVLGSVIDDVDVAVKKSRKRKRLQHDRSTQLSAAEVTGEGVSSELVADKLDLLVEPEPMLAASASGDLPDWLLAPSSAIGPLADDLADLIASGFRKGTPGAAADLPVIHEDRSVADPVDVVADDPENIGEDAENVGEDGGRQFEDEPAPLFDDEMPMPDYEEPPVADDPREFEETFIGATAPLVEPLPDIVEEEDLRDDDAVQSGAFSTWSDRTKKMCVLLSERLDAAGDDADLTLQSLIAGKSRSAAAVVFLEALILKTHDFIELDQRQPYEDIDIKRASRFHDGRSMADMVAITG